MTEITDYNFFRGFTQRSFSPEEAEFCLILAPNTFYHYKCSNGLSKELVCDGYRIQVSNNGRVCFATYDGAFLKCAKPTERSFEGFCFRWRNDDGLPTVEFGRREEVDYYPNCDGEYDRWGSEWVAQYKVTLNPKDNSLIIE